MLSLLHHSPSDRISLLMFASLLVVLLCLGLSEENCPWASGAFLASQSNGSAYTFTKWRGFTFTLHLESTYFLLPWLLTSGYSTRHVLAVNHNSRLIGWPASSLSYFLPSFPNTSRTNGVTKYKPYIGTPYESERNWKAIHCPQDLYVKPFWHFVHWRHLLSYISILFCSSHEGILATSL